ncbi:MAG TPA: neutral zinc metallopeptidase [Casimicrobiaceae bacterium]|nr:neutral zinc metallopeptidase [Casimicrobiaceae bacterium]
MKWQDMRESENVEERSGGGGVPFGGGMRLGGGAILVIVVVSVLLGKNPLEMLALLGGGGGPPVQTQSVTPGPAVSGPRPAEDPERRFVAKVLGDTEDFWSNTFSQMGARYEAPRLDLFKDSADSACGLAQPAIGPFYCPGDREVYLERDFFRELSQRFGAPGDFARAYVIAHEVGHHVQNQLGLMDKAQARMAAASGPQRNALSVRLELQADCLAGVWGNSAAKRGLIDASDVDSGIAAAMAVGDDRLQRAAGRNAVVPEQFTHGSSQQRAEWFKIGLESGDIRQCNTFASAASGRSR